MIHHVFDEVEGRPAAHHVGTGRHHLKGTHNAPLAVAEQQPEIFCHRRARLHLKGVTLFGGKEADVEQHHAAQPQHAHGAEIAHLLVPFADDAHQRQGNAADGERTCRRQEETPGLQGVTLFRVSGDDARHGAVRHVNEGVDQSQENVGHAGVDDFALRREVRRVEGQYADDAERDSAPQQERAELAVPRAGAVNQQPHQRVGDGVEHAGDQKQRAHNARRQAEDVGIEIGQQKHRGLPDEAAGGVTQPIANFVFHG